jgi:hypothetical protein
MAFRIRQSTLNSYDDLEDPYGHGELSAGERIGRPLPSRGRKLLVRGLAFLIMLGCGWGLMQNPAWLEWSMAQATAAYRAVEHQMANRPEPATIAASSARLSAPAVQPPTMDPPRPLPPLPVAETAPPVTTASLPPAASKPDEPQVTPLPPPSIDPLDPLQKRADAVGLHPNLSRVLLGQLSPEDYRNAETAIRTAIAETPDTGVFAWPRQRKPELAHFQVRFVAGAAPGCRRYVVTITKDRWSTTALPMERCGVRPLRAQRG